MRKTDHCEYRTIVVSCVQTQANTTIALDDLTYRNTFANLWANMGAGIAFMVASSLVMRPVFERMFFSLFFSRDKRHLKGVNNQRYQLNATHGTVPSSTATAYAVKKDDPISCEAASSVSGSQGVYIPGAGLDCKQAGKIKIQTGWEISTTL